MTAPFTDAAMPEVCARVVFQLAIRYARKRPSDELYGPAVMQAILEDLTPLQGTLVYSCALAAQFAVIRRERLLDWRAMAVQASRLGLGFRRCWYGEYKANRRDPRVTNRGVRRSD